MRAARIAGPKRFEIEDVDIPNIIDGECLIKLETWSVCGSDIRHAYGPVHPEEEYPMRVGGPCHEAAGTIVRKPLGQVLRRQRVIVLPGPRTGGGLVEYINGDEGAWRRFPTRAIYPAG